MMVLIILISKVFSCSVGIKVLINSEVFFLFCRYEGVDKQLQVGIEQARNLAALPFPEGSKV